MKIQGNEKSCCTHDTFLLSEREVIEKMLDIATLPIALALSKERALLQHNGSKKLIDITQLPILLAQRKECALFQHKGIKDLNNTSNWW